MTQPLLFGSLFGSELILPFFDLSSKTCRRKVGLVVLDGVFQGLRGLEAQSAVEPHGVVEGFDVVEDHGVELAAQAGDLHCGSSSAVAFPSIAEVPVGDAQFMGELSGLAADALCGCGCSDKQSLFTKPNPHLRPRLLPRVFRLRLPRLLDLRINHRLAYLPPLRIRIGAASVD